MKKISADDSAYVNFPLNDVWRAVSDFNSYKSWWPGNVEIKVLELNENLTGTKFQVKPNRKKGFICEVEIFQVHSKICLNYIAGIYSGKGFWELQKVNDQKTLIRYKIDLEIKDPLINFISKFADVAKIHSKMMTDIFKGLEIYLSKNTA